MTNHLSDTTRLQGERWLKHYYFTRAAFSVVWVALAFAIGQHATAIGAALLIVYPVWDALANYVDMSRSGGMHENLTQAFNVFASAVIAIAVIVVLSVNTSMVLDVFGVWAVLSGLLQLATAIRRWRARFLSRRPMHQCLRRLSKWPATQVSARSIFLSPRCGYQLANCGASLHRRIK